MSRPPEPLFLARQSYRRRRLGDAARVLPILGAVLLLLPILWADTARTSGGLVYIFATWAILIVIVAVVSSRLGHDRRGAGDPEGGEDGEF
ncbi:hypothetical protein GQ651_02780 [Alphaproteobacteria bacterium GH1-50]|uniref:Uncharacterized protein n=1 Tax=Kangsaoukella pontilimi TaxID=2691042 RepID=A0A7C9IEH1_9RHOB|nr:hypothetical protein [Kangsaoukella pontilimi]MXQ06764.1 hypothetical protein [Kangsaoukella pontilimi]